MCGISGSNCFEKAFNLYKLNLNRGSYSSGFMAVSMETGIFFIDKIFNTFEQEWFHQTKKQASNFDYFLFHSRAPTNSVNTIWTTENTHPFQWKNYYVAHNGIISNFKKLEEHVCFEVDSSIIPFLLYKNKGDLVKTYSSLQGLLTSWIYDSDAREISLVKAGSTLWKSIDNHSFSSSYFEKSEVVSENGFIFKYKKNTGFLPQEIKIDYMNSYFVL